VKVNIASDSSALTQLISMDRIALLFRSEWR